MPATLHPSSRHGRALRRRDVGFGLANLPLAALTACAASPPAPAGPGAPYHHTANGFRNPPGSPERAGGPLDWGGFFYRRLISPSEVPVLPPGHVLPRETALAGVRSLRGDGVTWLGHAAFLIRLDGVTILTDPYLSEYASPVPPLGPSRFAPPGLSVAQLPPIDVLLLSHNHYDHLDMTTLEALPGRERLRVIVPLKVSRYLDHLGFGTVTELDWHQRADVGGVSVTALPAVHFSKRTLFDTNETLWAGFALATGSRRLYFAGDTAFGPVFEEIGERYAPFDAALVPIGAYEPRTLMRASHVTPTEAVRIGKALGAERLVGMHWGTIMLTNEPPFEPPELFREAARGAGYGDDRALVLAIGETHAL